MIDLAEPDPNKRFKALWSDELWYSPDTKTWDHPVKMPSIGISPCQPLRDDLDPDPSRRHKWMGQINAPSKKQGWPTHRKVGMAYGPTLEQPRPSPDTRSLILTKATSTRSTSTRCSLTKSST